MRAVHYIKQNIRMYHVIYLLRFVEFFKLLQIVSCSQEQSSGRTVKTVKLSPRGPPVKIGARGVGERGGINLKKC